MSVRTRPLGQGSPAFYRGTSANILSHRKLFLIRIVCISTSAYSTLCWNCSDRLLAPRRGTPLRVSVNFLAACPAHFSRASERNAMFIVMNRFRIHNGIDVVIEEVRNGA